MVSLPAFPNGHHPGELSSRTADSSLSVTDSKEWRASSSAPTPSGPTHPHSHYQGQLYCFAQLRAGPALWITVLDEGQGQRFHSPARRLPSCLQQWRGVGSIFSFPFPPTAYEGGGREFLLFSCSQLGAFTLPPTGQLWLLPRQSTGSALLSAAVGEGRGRLSLSHDLRASFPICYRQRGAGEGGGHLSFSHSTIW